MFILYVHYGYVNRFGGAVLNCLSDRLKEQRRKLGLTQKNMADKLHIGPASYQRYENGTREPKLQTLCQLADIFGTSTDYLLGRSSENIPTYSNGQKEDTWTKLGSVLTSSEKEKVIKALTE